MEFVIEQVALPTTAQKGDKRLNKIQPILDKLIEVNQPKTASIFLPMDNAKAERVHFVHRTNKYAREVLNEAAEFKILAEPKGLRVWLLSYDKSKMPTKAEADKTEENGESNTEGEKQPEVTDEKVAEQAPEVNQPAA